MTETRRCDQHGGTQPEACLWCAMEQLDHEERRIVEGQQLLLGIVAALPVRFSNNSS